MGWRIMGNKYRVIGLLTSVFIGALLGYFITPLWLALLLVILVIPIKILIEDKIVDRIMEKNTNETV